MRRAPCIARRASLHRCTVRRAFCAVAPCRVPCAVRDATVQQRKDATMIGTQCTVEGARYA
eukprot:588305-Lingulodinium_polyedra.AAC.1